MQADPLRVSQIVANLLTNAAKYTDPHGRIRLLAALDADDVVIEVSDNGIGIAPESLPAVFDMFTQLRGTDDRASGLGIGLALTKGLVELHGGCDRRAQRGRRPRQRVHRAAAARRDARRARRAPDDGLEPRAASARRILVADDNRDAAESLAALLELEGHEVTLAYDGADALLAYDRVRPQICLLDIGMPHRTGNEVAAEIRSREDGRAADAGGDHRLGPGRRPQPGARRRLRPPPDQARRPARHADRRGRRAGARSPTAARLAAGFDGT